MKFPCYDKISIKSETHRIDEKESIAPINYLLKGPMRDNNQLLMCSSPVIRFHFCTCGSSTGLTYIRHSVSLSAFQVCQVCGFVKFSKLFFIDKRKAVFLTVVDIFASSSPFKSDDAAVFDFSAALWCMLHVRNTLPACQYPPDWCYSTAPNRK